MEMYFVRTCYACPEQYDVYDNGKNQIGYVKLRYGQLKATYPDFGGETVFEHTFEEDDLKGFFNNDDERLEMLNQISSALLSKMIEHGEGTAGDTIGFYIVDEDWLKDN